MRRSLGRTFFRPEAVAGLSSADSYSVAIYVFWGREKIGGGARALMGRDDGKIALFFRRPFP